VLPRCRCARYVLRTIGRPGRPVNVVVQIRLRACFCVCGARDGTREPRASPSSEKLASSLFAQACSSPNERHTNASGSVGPLHYIAATLGIGGLAHSTGQTAPSAGTMSPGGGAYPFFLWRNLGASNQPRSGLFPGANRRKTFHELPSGGHSRPGVGTRRWQRVLILGPCRGSARVSAWPARLTHSATSAQVIVRPGDGRRDAHRVPRPRGGRRRSSRR